LEGKIRRAVDGKLMDGPLFLLYSFVFRDASKIQVSERKNTKPTTKSLKKKLECWNRIEPYELSGKELKSRSSVALVENSSDSERMDSLGTLAQGVA
jgi:hypothetical protein